jgi:hypothetical protein
MSLALKVEGNYQGFIYFDAVTQSTRNLSGQLTSHPIGSGGLISDHFIRGNPRYQFSGVISGADISVGLNAITDGGINRPINTRGDIDPVSIKGDNNTLISLVPQTISQFFVDAGTSVGMSKESRTAVLKDVQGVLESLFKEDGITLVKLFEYRGLKLKNVIDGLVVVSLDFSEDPESGEALYVSMTLEKPTFTTLQVRKLSSSELKKLKSATVAAPLKEAAASKTDLGSNPVKAESNGSALSRIKSVGTGTPTEFKDDALMQNIKRINQQ